MDRGGRSGLLSPILSFLPPLHAALPPRLSPCQVQQRSSRPSKSSSTEPLPLPFPLDAAPLRTHFSSLLRNPALLRHPPAHSDTTTRARTLIEGSRSSLEWRNGGRMAIGSTADVKTSGRRVAGNGRAVGAATAPHCPAILDLSLPKLPNHSAIPSSFNFFPSPSFFLRPVPTTPLFYSTPGRLPRPR